MIRCAFSTAEVKLVERRAIASMLGENPDLYSYSPAFVRYIGQIHPDWLIANGDKKITKVAQLIGDGPTYYWEPVGSWLWQRWNKTRSKEASDAFINHLQGLYGSFIIRDKATGTPLVMQDMASLSSGYFGPLSQKNTKKVARGLGKKDPRVGNRILYTLVKRETLPAKLEFYPTATQVINSQMNQIMSNAIDQAIRTSR